MTRLAPFVLAAVGLLTVACGDSSSPALEADAAEAPRQWLQPTKAPIRAYPPHAIRSDGVGPYLLDAPLSDILHSLPDGPRVELLQLGRLVNWRVVRAEGGRLLIGADRHNKVAFVAILARDVARTATGLGVGSRGSELVKALGAEAKDGARYDEATVNDSGSSLATSFDEVTFDRRVFRFTSLPGVTFITDAAIDASPDKARVIAVVVTRATPSASGNAAASVARSSERALCRSGTRFAQASAEIVMAALRNREIRPAGADSEEPTKPLLLRYGCFSSGSPEAIAVGPDELALIAGEPGRLRRLAVAPLEQPTFVVPQDVDGDGRDEVIIGSHRRGRGERDLELRVLRWEAGRFVTVASSTPFDLSSAEASSAGVTPRDIDFVVELRPLRGALSVGGFYLARGDKGLRELAPILPVRLRLTHPPRRGLPLDELDGDDPSTKSSPDDRPAGPE